MIVHTATWSPGRGWGEPFPMPDGRSAAVLVFGAADVATHREQPLAKIAAVWTGHPIVGCSANHSSVDGEQRGATIVVAVLRFEHTIVRHHAVEVSRAGGARRACRQLASRLADPALQGALVFADGLTNGSNVARGFGDVLPGLPLGGAFASNDDQFESTWTIVDGRPTTGWVSAIGLVGEHVHLGFGAGTGWDPSGPEHLVTQSHANVVYSIDDQPASSFYGRCEPRDRHPMGRRSRTHPVAVSDLDNTTVLRTVVAMEPRTGALQFAGDVPQGSTVCVAHATDDALIHAAHLAAKGAALGDERFALMMSGVGRREVLNGRAAEEVAVARDALAPGARVVGVQTSAELVPDVFDDVQNQSCAVATIAESGRGRAQLP